ncbi:MAG TPA: hypothetical protein VH374_21685 [Polyangia bacterium]|jgi:hypothetical protein|nr:hypothetical protein [Polyangia bacterium]
MQGRQSENIHENCRRNHNAHFGKLLATAQRNFHAYGIIPRPAVAPEGVKVFGPGAAVPPADEIGTVWTEGTSLAEAIDKARELAADARTTG